jgi:hypothetical protein
MWENDEQPSSDAMTWAAEPEASAAPAAPGGESPDLELPPQLSWMMKGATLGAAAGTAIGAPAGVTGTLADLGGDVGSMAGRLYSGLAAANPFRGQF